MRGETLPSIRQDYNRGWALDRDRQILLPVAFGKAAGLVIPHLDMLAALAASMQAPSAHLRA